MPEKSRAKSTLPIHLNPDHKFLMKRLLILLLPCLVSVPAIAQLAEGNPEYEPFSDATDSGGTSYTPGETLAGQSRAPNPGEAVQSWWEYGPSISGGTTATNQPVIASGDLSYPGLFSEVDGRSAAFGGNGDSALMNLTTPSAGITSGTVYYSFVVQLTDLSNLDTNGTYFAAFCNLQSHDHGIGTPNSVAARVMVRSDGAGGFNIGLEQGGNNNPSGFNTAWDATSFTTSDTLFIVVSYTLQGTAQGTDDFANLWVNPDGSTFGNASAPDVDLTSSGSSKDIARIASFVLLDQADNEPSGLIDDLRIGLTWADVTPSSDFLNILQNPADQVLSDGATATFSVTAEGAPPLAYQWIKDGVTLLIDGGKISGAQSNVLTITGVSSADIGSYAVYVTNGVGRVVLSDSASLVLSDPAITREPQSHTNAYGTTATFMVTAAGTGPFTYQWHKSSAGDLTDGGNIVGSQSNVLAITGVSYVDTGGYYVTVNNALGSSVDSAVANLTVIDPVIVTQPASVTNTAGATVTFHVVADGTPTLLYQWQKDGRFLFDVGNVSGSISDTLTISDMSSADEGNYSVLVAGPYGTEANSVTSSNALLAVLSPVEITAQPNPRTVAAGSKVVLAVGVSGIGPLHYQWQRDGMDIPGATSFAYSVTNTDVGDSGDYSVIVSNDFSSATSLPAAVNISTNVQLYRTNLIVIRVGDGAQTLNLNGNSISLDQFTPDGTYVNTVVIPDEGPSAMTAIGWDNINGVNKGSTTGTCLTRSLDGRFMVVPGYNTNLASGDSLVASLAAAVPRGIGLVDSYGQYSLAVASTNAVFDATYWRAAITDGTNNFWGSGGVAGTYYFGFDQPPALVQDFFVNARSMALFNGNIYCAEASNPNGVLKIDGLPTMPTTGTNYLFPNSTGTFDLTVSPDGNLIYVADQRNVLNGGGVQRWEFDGAMWNLVYTLTDGFGDLGPRYIAADFSGANPVLYVTSNDASFDDNRIIRVVDTGASSTGTTLAYAGVNQTLRGIRFGPVQNTVAPRPRLAFRREGDNLILDWSGAATLQSAPEVTGPYSNVPGGASPYTNSFSTADQLFFRLQE